MRLVFMHWMLSGMLPLVAVMTTLHNRHKNADCQIYWITLNYILNSTSSPIIIPLPCHSLKYFIKYYPCCFTTTVIYHTFHSLIPPCTCIHLIFDTCEPAYIILNPEYSSC